MSLCVKNYYSRDYHLSLCFMKSLLEGTCLRGTASGSPFTLCFRLFFIGVHSSTLIHL